MLTFYNAWGFHKYFLTDNNIKCWHLTKNDCIYIGTKVWNMKSKRYNLFDCHLVKFL